MRVFSVCVGVWWNTCFWPAALLAVWSLASATRGEAVAQATTAKRLLEQARQAEVQGNAALQFALLREAARVAPENDLAHWHLGEMKVGERWVPVEDAQRSAAVNPKRAEYLQLRARSGDGVDGQLALGRWCKQNELDDEARFHWASVLAVDPTNDEALRSLQMWTYKGRPMTSEQIADAKQKQDEAKKAAERWEPLVAKWWRAVTGQNASVRAAALGKVRALREPEVIPSMEAVTLGRHAFRKQRATDCERMALAFVEALDNMPTVAATESLARHAVFSPSSAVRARAAETLQGRPVHEYVPLLLSGLAMPIESSFSVTTDRMGCVHYRHSLYREGANNDWSVDASYKVMQHSFPGRDYVYRIRTQAIEDVTESRARRLYRMARVAHQSALGFQHAVVELEAQIASANQAAENFNARIMPALATATGEDFGLPKQWWEWWQDNNEYYAYDHPVEHRYYSGTEERYYGHPFDTLSVNPSCFVKGTFVWTKTGQQPIETLALGDLVLAQNIDTGELAYKPVIGRTVRPPSPIIKLSVGAEPILTTRGHPFWVAGTGWRMAKELVDGAVLHGVTGAGRIVRVQETEPAEAYNLVVADFNTYFVGESGILVHDNTPRQPTRATVPGFVAK